MQTPGLPASHSSASRNTADNFFSDKPSHAAEQFGEVMNRTLHNGSGILPVRSNAHEQNARLAINHEENPENGVDKKSPPPKSKRAGQKTLNDRLAPSNSASGYSPLVAIIASATPAPASASSQPAGTSHESPDDSITPLSTDAAETIVTAANPDDKEPEISAARPIPAGLETQSAETTASVEHSQNPASADVAKEMATLSAETTADDATEPALSGVSGAPTDQIAEPKNAVGSMSASPPTSNGIAAAKQDMTMKKAEKAQKVAGSAEQELPGITASGEELPKEQKISEKAPSHGEKAESIAIELPTRVSTSIDSPSNTINSVDAASPGAIDNRVLERTHDIVALHAMRLTDTGAQTLHVVVKPGAGIQISLELRQSARGIEVSASLHKGDYDQLNRHWPDLQQRLEARGVRVSSLAPSENYTGTGNHFHQSKQQSSQQESLHAGAFAEFALAGSMTEAPAARAARASAYRGWETWA